MFDFARYELKRDCPAALQPWSEYDDAPRPQPATFDIAFRKEAWTKGGDFVPYCPGRPADVYVFAWHPIVDRWVADHRRPEQWRFFVVPEQQLPDQKTISINRLKDLGAGVGYDQLSVEIERQVARLGELKVEVELRNEHFVKPSRLDNRQSGE